jgi:hypothetical protein
MRSTAWAFGNTSIFSSSMRGVGVLSTSTAASAMLVRL